MREAILIKKAKIFMNGRSQAVRLPKEFRFDCDEVFVEKQGDKLILTAKRPSWGEFFALEPAFDKSFLEDRDELPVQEREFS